MFPSCSGRGNPDPGVRAISSRRPSYSRPPISRRKSPRPVDFERSISLTCDTGDNAIGDIYRTMVALPCYHKKAKTLLRLLEKPGPRQYYLGFMITIIAISVGMIGGLGLFDDPNNQQINTYIAHVMRQTGVAVSSTVIGLLLRMSFDANNDASIVDPGSNSDTDPPSEGNVTPRSEATPERTSSTDIPILIVENCGCGDRQSLTHRPSFSCSRTLSVPKEWNTQDELVWQERCILLKGRQ